MILWLILVIKSFKSILLSFHKSFYNTFVYWDVEGKDPIFGTNS